MGNCNERCSGNNRNLILEEDKKIEATENRIETFIINKEIFNNKTSININFPIEKISIKYLNNDYFKENFPKFRLIICEIPECVANLDTIDKYNIESVAYIRTGYSENGILTFNNNTISEHNKSEVNKDCLIPLTDEKRKNCLFLSGFYITIEFINKFCDYDLEVTLEGMDIIYYILKDNELIKEWKNLNGIKHII